jgi:hypothetical protein
MHTASLVPPTAVEYLPAEQLRHMELAAVEYFPATQCVQSVDEVAPISVAYLPASHELQKKLPAKLE